jgi:hypothetical protein
VQICQQGGGTTTGFGEWRDAPPVVNVADVARSAVAQLQLPSPMIRLNPAPPAPALTFVGVWFWLDGGWGAQTATASVPGLSVTAKATPQQVRWQTGDGAAVVVCDGPGMAWTAGMDPKATSPCGHTYTRPSSGEPSETFTVRATVTWTVNWAGGGATGAVPDLVTTSTAAIRVAKAPSENGSGH